jgi:hypothetical protein
MIPTHYTCVNIIYEYLVLYDSKSGTPIFAFACLNGVAHL